jgi:hypothetical protein
VNINSQQGRIVLSMSYILGINIHCILPQQIPFTFIIKIYTCGMLSVEKERRSKIDSQTVNEKRQGIDCNQYFVYFSVGKKIK